MSETVNQLQATIGEISVSQTQDAGAYSLLGNTVAGPGFGDLEDRPAGATGSYGCTEETLTVTVPEIGEVTYNRVDDILPTPVPTASP